MAERATVFQATQIGVETTSGTSVAASKLLSSLSFSARIRGDVNQFRPTGQKFATVAALGREWSEFDIEGQPTYTEMVYPLSSVMRAATITTPGGATNARLWTFDIDHDGPDTRKTFTLEQGSSVRAHEFTYVLVNEFGIEFSREEGELSGAAFGQLVADGITMTSSPTALALVPILPKQVNVYLADEQADLDAATALTRVLRVGFSISDRANPLWVLNRDYTSFAADVETAPTVEATLLMEADATGMGLLTQLRSGATKFLRIEAVGGEIESGQDYLFQIDLAASVMEPSEWQDEDGVYAIEWTLSAVRDATWGKAVEIKVQNALTAL